MTNLPQNLTRLAELHCTNSLTNINDASEFNLINDIILEDPAARNAVQNTHDIHSTTMTLILDAGKYHAHYLLASSDTKDTKNEEHTNAVDSFKRHLFKQNSLLHAAAIVAGTQQLLAKLHSCPAILHRAADSAATYDYAAVDPTKLENMTIDQSSQACDHFLGMVTIDEDYEWTFVMRHDDAVSANQSPLGVAIDTSYARATEEVAKALSNDDFERWLYDDGSPIGSTAAATASERCRIAIRIWAIRDILAPA